MNSIFPFNDYIDLEFYLYEDNEYKKVLVNLLELTKYIKASKFYFGDYYNDKLGDFNEDKLNEVLNCNWDKYENYFLTLHGIKNQFFNLRISPFLKEVSVAKVRIHKAIFEKNKIKILDKCNNISEYSSTMYGFADASVSNPYFYKGYGQIKFGAHWLTWYGEWALQYFKDKHIEEIKDNSYDFVKKETFIRSQLYVSPWKYRSKQFHKTYRNFMRKVKIEDIVLEYNKKHEFSEIEKKN